MLVHTSVRYDLKRCQSATTSNYDALRSPAFALCRFEPAAYARRGGFTGHRKLGLRSLVSGSALFNLSPLRLPSAAVSLGPPFVLLFAHLRAPVKTAVFAAHLILLRPLASSSSPPSFPLTTANSPAARTELACRFLFAKHFFSRCTRPSAIWSLASHFVEACQLGHRPQRQVGARSPLLPRRSSLCTWLCCRPTVLLLTTSLECRPSNVLTSAARRALALHLSVGRLSVLYPQQIIYHD